MAENKVRTKMRKNRVTIDDKYMGPEPVFQKGETSAKASKRLALWSKGGHWYNYYYKPKDYVDCVLTFATDVYGYDKDKIKTLKKLKDWQLTGKLGKVAKLWSRGYEYTKDEFARWEEELKQVYNEAVEAIEENLADAPPPKPVISVQQRQRTKMNETIMVDWDEIIDGWIDEKYNQKIDVFKLAKQYDLKGSSINIFKDAVMMEYQPIKDAYDGTCDQAVEAYSHITKRRLNKMLKTMEGIFSDLEQLKTANKAAKVPRAKKPKSSDAQVKSLKYRVDSVDDKVSSINPVMIPGKEVLFVYNTKSRKLIQYNTNSTKGFEVSGTTIKNICEKSRQTTLRKPEEILPLVLKKSIKQIDKLVWDTVTTKISEPNGRINADCILLRVL